MCNYYLVRSSETCESQDFSQFMASRSPSPETGFSSEEDVADESAKVQQNTEASKKKVWSWLHIAVSTGNIEKVIRLDLFLSWLHNADIHCLGQRLR